MPIDRPEFHRPDPLIYDQRYLMSLGFAVAWDNPDIQLFKGGSPVSSSLLDPGTEYEVVARIWNGSFDAPVAQMPVHLSYLDFGMGTISVPIGTIKVDLGVKGGPNQPAFASVPWTTPTTPGHYCLQVLLDPPDDLNFMNNLGQENTNVGEAHSDAEFTFTLRNDTRRQRTYRFGVDAYTVGEQDPCDEREPAAAARKRRAARHRWGEHPLPAGWTVAFDPPSPTLAPGESITVRVLVSSPPGFAGAQVINVNAFHDGGFAGGVTLTVVVGP